MSWKRTALVFAAGYETREAIEYGSWKLALMAVLLLGFVLVSWKKA